MSAAPPLSFLLQPPSPILVNTETSGTSGIHALWNGLFGPQNLPSVDGDADAFAVVFFTAVSANELIWRIEKKGHSTLTPGPGWAEETLVLTVATGDGGGRQFTGSGRTQLAVLADFLREAYGELRAIRLLEYHDLLSHRDVVTGSAGWLKWALDASLKVFGDFLEHMACRLAMVPENTILETGTSKEVFLKLFTLFATSKETQNFSYTLSVVNNSDLDETVIRCQLQFYTFKGRSQAKSAPRAVYEALQSYSAVSGITAPLPDSFISQLRRFDPSIPANTSTPAPIRHPETSPYMDGPLVGASGQGPGCSKSVAQKDRSVDGKASLPANRPAVPRTTWPVHGKTTSTNYPASGLAWSDPVLRIPLSLFGTAAGGRLYQSFDESEPPSASVSKSNKKVGGERPSGASESFSPAPSTLTARGSSSSGVRSGEGIPRGADLGGVRPEFGPQSPSAGGFGGQGGTGGSPSSSSGGPGGEGTSTGGNEGARPSSHQGCWIQSWKDQRQGLESVVNQDGDLSSDEYHEMMEDGEEYNSDSDDYDNDDDNAGPSQIPAQPTPEYTGRTMGEIVIPPCAPPPGPEDSPRWVQRVYQYREQVWQSDPRWNYTVQLLAQYFPAGCSIPTWVVRMRVVNYPPRSPYPKKFRVTLTRGAPDGSSQVGNNMVSRPTITGVLTGIFTRLRKSKGVYFEVDHFQKYAVRRMLGLPQGAPDSEAVRTLFVKAQQEKTRLAPWFTHPVEHGLWGVCTNHTHDPQVLGDPIRMLEYLQRNNNLFLFFLCLNFVVDRRDIPGICTSFEEIADFYAHNWGSKQKFRKWDSRKRGKNPANKKLNWKQKRRLEQERKQKVSELQAQGLPVPWELTVKLDKKDKRGYGGKNQPLPCRAPKPKLAHIPLVYPPQFSVPGPSNVGAGPSG